jgi:tetratricopeptide (TPR) repeat protein
MSRLAIVGLLILLLVAGAAPAGAQLRNVTINTESDEGKLLQQAGEQTDAAKKIELLEQFLAKFSSHDAAGYVHLQLLAEYLKVNNFDKALEHGEKALAKDPQDLEANHLQVKAAEGKGDPEGLVKAVARTQAAAKKILGAAKPADADEAEAWKRSVEFAGQIEQYNQHALFGSAVKQTTPQAKILLLDTLRKNYPGGVFEKAIDAQYVVAYQQAGDGVKLVQAAEAALVHEPDNEAYLFLVADSWVDPAKNRLAESQALAEKILNTLPAKPKPAQIADADWEKHKSAYLGLGRSVLGRSLANQGKNAPAHKELLAAAAALKGNNDALAPVYFYLGFVSAKLERRKDAVTYLNLASKIPGPYQAPAADMLKKISAALTGR